jgi:hypothetical protein
MMARESPTLPTYSFPSRIIAIRHVDPSSMPNDRKVRPGNRAAAASAISGRELRRAIVQNSASGRPEDKSTGHIETPQISQSCTRNPLMKQGDKEPTNCADGVSDGVGNHLGGGQGFFDLGEQVLGAEARGAVASVAVKYTEAARRRARVPVQR